MRLALLGLLLAIDAAPQQRPDIRVDVDLVPVVCSVTDHNVPVTGLQKSDFQLREDAKLQEIKYLWKESELPLTIGLIVDVSASQATQIKKHRQTVLQFLRTVLRP